jgi:prophage regulatory protein
MSSIQILRLKQVSNITGLSRSSIYAMMKKRSFPKHIQLSARCVGWLASDVCDFIQSRINVSRNVMNGGAV